MCLLWARRLKSKFWEDHDCKGEKRRIAVSAKQLQPHPWDAVGRENTNWVSGFAATVTRVRWNSGAFVELEPGLEGLIHVFRNVVGARKSELPSEAS